MYQIILTVTLLSLNFLNVGNVLPAVELPQQPPQIEEQVQEQPVQKAADPAPLPEIESSLVPEEVLVEEFVTVPGSKAVPKPRITYFLPAPSQSDCTEYEVYDIGRQTCNLGCVDTADCALREERANTEIQKKADIFISQAEDIDGVNISNPLFDEDTTLSAYTITNGEKYTLVKGAPTEYDEFIISVLKEIMPQDQSDAYFRNLIIYSDSTQGRSAYVKSYNNFEDFDLYINDTFFEQGYLSMIKVLMHEYAHILTLNSDQLSVTRESGCSRFYSRRRCFNRGSIIQQFYNEFGGVNAPYSEENYATKYGSQSVEEDIAETFVAFLLDEKHDSNTLVYKKINFFNRYPEIREMKSRLEDRLQGFRRTTIDIQDIPLKR